MTQDKFVLVPREPTDLMLYMLYRAIANKTERIDSYKQMLEVANLDANGEAMLSAAPTIAQPITREHCDRINAILVCLKLYFEKAEGDGVVIPREIKNLSTFRLQEVLTDMLDALDAQRTALPSQNESVRLALPEVADRVEAADTYSYGFYVGWNAYRNLLLEYNPTINADEREG